MKKTKKSAIWCLLSATIFTTAFTCDTHTFSYEYGCGSNSHPNIRFINYSGHPIWLEWNPHYPMERSDSLFSGFQVQVKDTFNMMPVRSNCWEGELMNVSFIRVFLFDAPYNPINNHPDSLRHFQDEHLIYMHWYTKEELDGLNWLITYSK